MNKEQAQAIVDLINSTSAIRGRASLCASDGNKYGWFVSYQFRRPDDTPDYDLITSMHAFHRWLGYRGKDALNEE